MHSYQQVKALIKQFAGQANTLVIPRVFIDFTGDHLAALLLSQILYWSDRTDDPEGWFYKTADEWQAELGMSAYQVKRAAAVLAPLGIESRVRKVKLTPKSHYRVDMKRFTDLFMQFLENQETSKSKNYKLENQETSKSMESEETSKSYKEHRLHAETTPPTPAPAKNQNGAGGGGDEIAILLDEYNIGASDSIAQLYREQYPNVDAATIRQSIENLLADQVPKGTIVNRLRSRPPAPGKPYQRSRAGPKTGIPIPTRPNIPPDMLTPAQIAERSKAKRAERDTS